MGGDIAQSIPMHTHIVQTFVSMSDRIAATIAIVLIKNTTYKVHLNASAQMYVSRCSLMRLVDSFIIR